jgi:hypothetical protein
MPHEVAEVIAALRGQELEAQEQAVEQLDNEVLRTASDPLLFAIGRGLGEAARTGTQSASNRLHAYRLSSQNIQRHDVPLYAGALYDLYFDTDGQTRPLPLDGNVEAVLAASALPMFGNAVAVVVDALAEDSQRFLALPIPGGPEPRLELQLVTDPKALENRDELNQIRVGDRELIEDLEMGEPDLLSAFFAGARKANVRDLTIAISRRYSVPRAWLTTNSTPANKLAWVPSRGFRQL